MKNMRISRKFILSFGIILVLFTIATGFAILSLQSVIDNFTTFYERPYQNATQMAEMRRAIQAGAKNIGYATMSEDLQDTQKYIDECQSELSILKGGIEFLYANYRGDLKIVDDFKATMDSSIAAKEKVYENALINKNDVAINAYFNEYMPLLLKENEQLIGIDADAKQTATDLYAQSKKSAQAALIIVIALVVITFVLTICMAFYITRGLKKPIIEIENAAKQLAAGNLNATIEYTSRDELGGLAQSTHTLIANLKGMIGDMTNALGEISKGNFDVAPTTEFTGDFIPLRDSISTIIISLSKTLGQIRQSADQVSSGSDQVSSGAQALSQGATE